MTKFGSNKSLSWVKLKQVLVVLGCHVIYGMAISDAKKIGCGNFCLLVPKRIITMFNGRGAARNATVALR